MAGGLLGDSTNGTTIDVEAFLDSDIGRAISRIIDLGCLVSIGTTRDGGAVSLTITHDGQWDREYFREAASAVEWLQFAERELTVRYALVPRHAQPAVQKPRRGRSRLT